MDVICLYFLNFNYCVKYASAASVGVFSATMLTSVNKCVYLAHFMQLKEKKIPAPLCERDSGRGLLSASDDLFVSLLRGE